MGSRSDSSATGDLFDMDMIVFLVTTILTLERMWMDGFILAVNCRDWIKKICLSLTDRILTLQGGIRICHGCMGMIWYTLAKFCPWITQRDYIFKMFMFGLSYFITCNLWLTAFLCSYYCVKIADFRHPFFIRLKLKLSGLASTWLLGSMTLALPSSLPYACSDLKIGCKRSPSYSFTNENVTDAYPNMMLLHMHTLMALGCLAAFTICATSAVLLLFSLWRHRHRMLGSWDGHRSPQTDAHFQAVIIILSLLVNNIVVFISILLLLSSDFVGNCIANLAALSILHCCFSVQPLISLWGNKKLKNELCRALYFAKCRGCAI